MNKILQAIANYLDKHGIKVKVQVQINPSPLTQPRLTINHPQSIYTIVINHTPGQNHITYTSYISPHLIYKKHNLADPELLPTILKTTQKILKTKPANCELLPF
jgi:hypothetical protein